MKSEWYTHTQDQKAQEEAKVRAELRAEIESEPRVQEPIESTAVGMTNATKLARLMSSLMSNDLETFIMLLETIDDKSTLHDVFTDACLFGKDAHVKLMLDFGVDVNIFYRADDKRIMCTGLMCAAKNGRESTVRLLLAHGADVLLKSGVLNKTAREYANSREIIKILSDAEQVQEAAKKAQEEAAKLRAEIESELCAQEAAAKPMVVGMTDATKLNILLALIDSSSFNEFNIILQCVNDKSILGDVFIKACRIGNVAFVKSMIDFGIDINIRDTKNGSTGLMFAAQNEQVNIMKLLLDNGADALLTSRSGKTAWQFCNNVAICAMLEYVEHIQETQNAQKAQEAQEATNHIVAATSTMEPDDSRGATLTVADSCINHENSKSDEKLFLTSLRNDLKLKILHEFINSNCLSEFKTVLSYILDKPSLTDIFIKACRNGYDDFVKVLIDFGVDVDKRDNVWGSTGLMFAAQQRHTSTVNLLLDAGANVLLISSSQGKTAYQFCSVPSISDILKAAEQKVIKAAQEATLTPKSISEDSDKERMSTTPTETPTTPTETSTTLTETSTTLTTTSEGDDILAIHGRGVCQIYFRKQGTTSFVLL